MKLLEPATAEVELPPPARVLLVDDHPANLLALEATLEPLGLGLDRASSGEEALRLLLQGDYAAVLLDVQMPELDGYQTAALIRSRERNRATPILFVTAIHRDLAHAFKGYAHGAVDYLTKPFSGEVVRSKVAALAELFYERERMRLAEERRRGALQRHLEQRGWGLVDLLPECVWVADPTGQTVYWNRAWRAFVGEAAPLEELNDPWSRLHPEEQAVRAGWLTALSKGEPYAAPARLRRADGAWVRCRLKVVPDLDPDGSVQSWVALCVSLE